MALPTAFREHILQHLLYMQPVIRQNRPPVAGGTAAMGES